MTEPRVVPRAEHPLSRRDIDPDALKVLYRLRQFNYTGYLVGGSVRDLLLGRRPKDFDIGTSAHPYQVKKLFRNCWIIGRRFRLAHVRFGPKVIEVATFRRQLAPGEEVVQDGVPASIHRTGGEEPANRPHPAEDHLFHRDNTFGTPEEDAFRRDFTINALFYDIDSFSIIDYVGGLDDLRARIVRSIGDPEVRFREDPVRMMRAVALAARLDFSIDQPILDAIRVLRHEIARSSPARLLEEFYKILRSGSSERIFRDLAMLGLLEPISTELHAGAASALWRSLAEVDAYRRRFESTPDTMTNTILLGSLLVPVDQLPVTGWQSRRPERRDGEPPRPSGPRLGALPLARRDIERLRQLLGLQRRLRDIAANPGAKRAVTHRSIFGDALTWLDIHGGQPDLTEHWKAIAATRAADQTTDTTDTTAAEAPAQRTRRRRRRRRRFRPTPQS
jgi:poly(A) polymerase